MYFRLIEGRNFGPFASFRHELQRGSIGIFGRNGAGKSSLINAMYGLVTNDFGRFDGVKVDCIRNTSAKEEASWLYGEVEHNGHVLKIKRSLRPAGTELVIDDSKPITHAPKAQQEIEAVLGVDGTMLDLYVFKSQDKIYDFLSTTPAVRAKAFAVLCRTERCEEMWEYLGRFLNQDAEVNAQITDNSDELATEVSTLEASVAESNSAIEKERGHLLNGKSEQSARDILRRQDRVEDLLAQKDKETQRVEALTVSQREAEAKKARRKARGEELKASLQDAKEGAEAARAALAVWAQHKKQVKRRRELREQAEALVDEERTVLPPVAPKSFGKADLSALKKVLQRRESEAEHAREVLLQFEASGVVACPTCGTPAASLANHLQTQRKLVSTYEAWVDGAVNQIALLEEYDGAVRKYEKWRAGFDARQSANQEALAALGKDAKTPAGDEIDLQAVVDAYEELGGRLEAARESYRDAAEIHNKVDAELRAASRRLGEIVQEVAENTEPEDKVQRARQRLDEHTAASHNIARLEGEKRGLDRQIEAKQEELAKLRSRLKRSKRIRRAARVANEVRELLHRDGLPQEVARVNLARMEGDINEGLGHFGDPFWIESDDHLNFVVHKPGEPPQPAGRLSTGQRVVVALAFWPAVASLWSEDLGMLALDEPTANLDGDNRKFLAQALGRLTAEVRGKRQLIMVTHDPDLRSSFDQVIDLGVMP